MNENLTRIWSSALLTLLGLLYLWIGLAADGRDAVLGYGGGLLIVVATVAARRYATLALTLLVVGALPLAVATWWSVVTPALAVLALLIGVVAVRSAAGTKVLGIREVGPRGRARRVDRLAGHPSGAHEGEVP